MFVININKLYFCYESKEEQTLLRKGIQSNPIQSNPTTSFIK